MRVILVRVSARLMRVSLLRRTHAGQYTEIHAGQFTKIHAGQFSCASVSILRRIHAGQFTEFRAGQFSCASVRVLRKTHAGQYIKNDSCGSSFMRVRFRVGQFHAGQFQ